MLAVLKVCGGRMDKADEVITREANKNKTFDDWMMPFIRSPDNIKAQAWDIFTALVYIIGLVHDSFCIAFYLYPLLDVWQMEFVLGRALLMLVDNISTFFIAIPKQ